MKIGLKSRFMDCAPAGMVLLLLLCLGMGRAMGQTAMDVSCKVTLVNRTTDNSKKEIRGEITYALFSSKEKADAVKNRISNIFLNADPLRAYEELNKIKRTEKIVRKSPNGRFSLKAFPGMGIVIMSEDDAVVDAFVVKEGQTDYTLKMEVNRSVGTTVMRKRKPRPRTMIIDTDDGTEKFKIQIPIDENLIKESSRLIIQTYAVDCMTDDTIDYCAPIVYEEGEYHGLQDKRMGYDFFKNDKLASGYATGGIPAIIDATIIYKKPDKKKSYKGPSKYSIEDYHHVYFEDFVGGSCLRVRPFKFLDFSVAIPDMALTEEFHAIAEEVVENVFIDLHLKFVQGKDELTGDSINEIERAKIEREFEARKNERLFGLTITGTASPEGGEKINSELAAKRVRKALAFISSYLPRGARPDVKTRVYTWDDVADLLVKRRMPGEAQALRDVIAAKGSDRRALEGAIKELPFYASSVVPIMENMRVMKFGYSYIKQHVMEPEEAVEAYYRNKGKYLSGEKMLSDGDYYNLYTMITDTAELDTVTIMAYNWLKKQPEDKMYGQKIAPYVYYRMARLLQDRSTPDTLLLAPFLDDSVGFSVVAMREGVPVKMNRPDIYVAQAMNYYLLQEFGKAQGLIEDLKASGNIIPGLEKLEMFMTLKNKFGSAEDDDDFIRAKNFVLSSSDENKAILYTEVPEWRVSFEDTDDLINRLEDNNPKKWYLKGLLWSAKAGTEERLDDYNQEDGFRKLSEDEEDELMMKDQTAYVKYRKELEEYNRQHANDTVAVAEAVEETEQPVDITGIRHYLAYFHHCFQMEPAFKRLYYSEGHIDEDMRKKSKYLKKDFPGYEYVFKLLKKRDDLRRSELVPPEDDGDITANPSDATGRSDEAAPSEAPDSAGSSSEAEQSATEPVTTESTKNEK